MKAMYLLGEPNLNVPFNRKNFRAPVGQVALCKQIRKEGISQEHLISILQQEYLAIVSALNYMDIDFRIIHTDIKNNDKKVLSACINLANCRLLAMDPNFYPPSIAYPSDFCIVLPGLVLFNDFAVKLIGQEKYGYQLIASPFGEGGRVLHSQNTVLVCNRIVANDGKSRPTTPADIKQIEEAGIKVGMIPAVMGAKLSNIRELFMNDHIDRVAALVTGKDLGLHLVVDPKIFTAYMAPGQVGSCTPIGTQESIRRIREACEPLDITVHVPSELRVPYSLNLRQFADGRVLMTSGDDELAQLMGDIVGEEKVVQTSVPIRFFPVWAYAGIRCLIADAPLPVLLRV